MGYREAEMIELHDANIQIAKHNYSKGVVGWTDDEPDSIETIYIHGEVLEHIFKGLGIEPQTWTTYDEKLKQHITQSLSSINLPLFKRNNKEITRNRWNIHKILVEKESEKTVNIRLIISSRCKTDDGMVTVFHLTEMMYSGSFTIWWKPDCSNDIKVKHKIADLSGEEFDNIINKTEGQVV